MTNSTKVGSPKPALHPSYRNFDVLCLYSFVVLGTPDGMIGTAWPSIRRSFGAPLEDIGLVLLAGTVGGVATSAVSGLLVGRVGARLTIMLAAVTGAIGATVVTSAPGLASLVLGGGFIGMTAGLMDSAVNAIVALSGRPRLLNLLHGCYGVGTTVAPLVVTGALLVGSSWRPAYAVLSLLELTLLALWWRLGRGGSTAGPPAGPPGPARGPGPGPAPSGLGSSQSRGGARLALLVALGLFVFLVYTGVEVSAGQWEPSFDRGPLHLSAGPTGLAVFGYWGSLTLSRMALAVPRRPPSPDSVVRWGAAVGLAGAAIVWWQPTTWATLVGFVVLGAGLAGIFPALVSLTPGRVGTARAHHVIGWQIGAAGLGGSSISALFGVVFQHAGFRWLGPCLVMVAALLLVTSELLRLLGRPLPARGA